MADPMGGTAPPGRAQPVEGRLVQVRRDDRRPLLLGVIVVTAILGLAVLKPWADPGDPSRAAEADAPTTTLAEAAISPGPPATPEPTPPGYGAPGGQCYQGAGWRVFALETRTGQSVQHWLSIEPGSAGSPRDPAVPLVRIVTDRLLRSRVLRRIWTRRPPTAGRGARLGAGSGGPGRPGRPGAPHRVHAAPGGPRGRLPAAAGSRGEAGPRGEADQGWSPGRYVFAVRQGPGQSDEQWFGVEVLDARQVSVAP